MNIVATFDPSAAASGSFNAGFGNSSGKMVVYNESNISIQLQWGSFTTYCPAWTAMLYCVQTPNALIQWQQLYSLPVSGGAPLSVVVVEAFSDTESIPGTYPASLVRSTSIGNAIPLSTSATSIANDGNAANTSIVEATVSGDAGSAVKWTNDAQFKNGDAAHPGTVQIDNNLIHSDGSGNLTAHGLTATNGITSEAGLTVSGGGTQLDGPNLITTDGSGNFTNAGIYQFNAVSAQKISAHSGGDLINANAGTDITINAPNTGGGHEIVFTVGGVRVAHIDANGNLVLKGALTQNGAP